ncbi:MAG: acyl-CoA thioesterase [Turneriella sp.]|nr:acyl-CoA thioesterase [Leptospiraceae bacterium]MCX7632252.1 acyl-CoA thioesterase [Turneriella sp.]
MADAGWERFTVTTETVVRWRDLDAYNHVNNSVYLNYFEEARIAYYFRLAEIAGVAKTKHEIFEGFSTVLASTSIDFRGQGRLHDTLVIGIRYTAIRKIFLDAEYGVFNKTTKALLARGKSTQVAMDLQTNKPMRVSEQFIRAAQQLEGEKLKVIL